MKELEALQSWYLDQCDGDWEHQYGVSIGTLDNPGWFLRVDLRGTALESRAFVAVEDLEADSEWMQCKVENEVFEAHCGPTMLSAAIVAFLEWAGA